LGTDISELNNGITLVKPREKEFYPKKKKKIKKNSKGNSP